MTTKPGPALRACLLMADLAGRSLWFAFHRTCAVDTLVDLVFFNPELTAPGYRQEIPTGLIDQYLGL